MIGGRLFGPGIAGTGVDATARWQEGRLHVTADGRERVAADPVVEARGFNATQWRVSWAGEDGDYAFFIADAGAKAEFSAAAPAALAAASAGAARREAAVGRRFRGAWGALAAIFAAPVIALVALLLNADAIVDWAVARVPHEQEAKLGDLVLAQTRARLRLVDIGPAVEALQTIGTPLTAGTRHRYRWFLAEGPEVNAFAAPGGVVVVHAGLIKAARRPEELAAVIAHEVAHAELRHGLRNTAKSLGLRALAGLVMGDAAGILGEAAVGLGELKFSREAERAADAEGLRRLFAAGVDPAGAVDFFERLAQQSGTGVPPWLSTHPASGERAASLRAAIAAAPVPAGGWRPLPVDWVALRAAIP